MLGEKEYCSQKKRQKLGELEAVKVVESRIETYRYKSYAISNREARGKE